MAELQEAARLKNLGNECFTAKNYREAAHYFTQAIDLNPDDHVFYSNRSACYANLNEYDKALVDAQLCVDIKPDWAKGYLRKGLAEFYLKRYAEAEKTYKEGLKLEPGNEQLKEGLQRVLDEKTKAPPKESAGSVDPGKFFAEALDMLKANPDTSEYFNDPEYVKKLGEIKKNPNSVAQYMDDPRIKKSFDFLQTQFAKKKGGSAGTKSKEEESKSLTADEEKTLGNDEYRNKNYEKAIYHYNRAIAINPNEPIYHTNKAIVYLEMEESDKAIEACDKSISICTSSSSPDKVKLAKAYAKKASAYAQKGDVDQAMGLYRKSLAENEDARIREEMNKLQPSK